MASTIKRRPVPSQLYDSQTAQPLMQPRSDPRADQQQAHQLYAPKETVSPVSPQSPTHSHHQQQQHDNHGYHPISHDTFTSKQSSSQNAYGVSSPSEPPTNSTPNSPTGRSDERPRYYVFRVWLWEILALLLAIGLMIAKIVLLSQFQGKELPEWPLSINLSTLLAIFSIIQRASLLLILAEIMGQAKWIWFAERDRPLFHLETFNGAGRSTLGALQLFLAGLVNRAKFTVKSLILTAALITVLSFTIGPLTQQAIGQEDCRQLQSSDAASIPAANYVPGGSTNRYRANLAGFWEVDAGMRGVMLNGLTNPEGKDTAIQARCDSGDCDFDDYGTGITYSSIAMCSRCIDSSSVMSEPDSNFNVSLGNSAWVEAFQTRPSMSVGMGDLDYAESLFDDELISLAPKAMYNVSILSITDSTCGDGEGQRKCPHDWADKWPKGSDVVATSCMLYPCLESYHGAVRGGSLEERVVSRKSTQMTYRNATAGPSSNPYDNFLTAFQSPCILDNSTWYTAENISEVKSAPGRIITNITLDDRNITAPEECLYHMFAPYYIAIQVALKGMLNGSCTSDMRRGNTAACGENWWLLSLHNNGSATPESLSTHIGSLTTAMTNHFRKTGNGPRTGNDDNGEVFLPAGVLGDTLRGTSCTTVDCRWMIPPIVLVAITAVLLIWVMLHSRFRDRKQPVWKASILPLLVYGLKDDKETAVKPERPGYVQSGKEVGGVKLEGLAELETMAKRRMVRFEKEGTGLDAGLYPGETSQASTTGMER
ncbi:hypothetical protein CC79DRAFT_915891 [Sarocladium strictum]